MSESDNIGSVDGSKDICDSGGLHASGESIITPSPTTDTLDSVVLETSPDDHDKVSLSILLLIVLNCAVYIFGLFVGIFRLFSYFNVS